MLRRIGRPGSAARGFVILALMQIAFGFALNGQQNIVTNYFEGPLGLAGPQFGSVRFQSTPVWQASLGRGRPPA